MRYFILFLLLFSFRAFCADVLIYEREFNYTFDYGNRVYSYYMNLIPSIGYPASLLSSSKNYKIVVSYVYSSSWFEQDVQSSQNHTGAWSNLLDYQYPGCLFVNDDNVNPILLYTPSLSGSYSFSYSVIIPGSTILIPNFYQLCISYYRGSDFTVKIYETTDDPNSGGDPGGGDPGGGGGSVGGVSTGTITGNITGTNEDGVINLKVDNEIKVDVKTNIEVPDAPEADNIQVSDPLEKIRDKLRPNINLPSGGDFHYPTFNIPLPNSSVVTVSIGDGLKNSVIAPGVRALQILVNAIAYFLITLVTFKAVLKLFRKNS